MQLTLQQFSTEKGNATPATEEHRASINNVFKRMLPNTLLDVEAGGSPLKRRRLTKVAQTGWEAFKTALDVVEKASNGVPVLQQVLGGLVALIEKVDVSPLYFLSRNLVSISGNVYSWPAILKGVYVNCRRHSQLLAPSSPNAKCKEI